MTNGNTFQGIPLTGPPNTFTMFGSGHASYGWDKDGNLKFKRYGLQLTTIDGRMRSVYVEIPANLQAAEGDFPTLSGVGVFEPLDLSRYDIGPGNIATEKDRPDEAPEWEKWGSPPDPFRVGWTDNPRFDANGKPTNPGAKYVLRMENGEPVFADDPPGPLGAVAADATDTLVLEVQGALARFVATRK